MNIEIEDGIPFSVVRIYNVQNIHDVVTNHVKYGYYKVILKNDSATRTYYFNNGVETSKDKIIQDERIKSLRR